MMNDCQNVAVREVLPEFVHGALAASDRDRVQAHVDACEDCASELLIIRSLYESAPVVQLDIAKIAAAIPPYRRKSSGMRRVYMELAAACLIGAIGISALVVHDSRSRAGDQQASVQSASSIASTGAASAGSGLALVNTSELSDASLAALTQDLDNLQAMPTEDPESVTPGALQGIAAPIELPSAAGDSA
jgi:hypothetical protein